MYSILKNILFLMDPEDAHYLTLWLLKIPGVSFLLKKIYNKEHELLGKEVFGLRFKNPVGLAAGMDKNATSYEQFGDMGFGFVEVGTITPLPQRGNQHPRLFRLTRNEAIINRMGFNNSGLLKVIKNLRRRKNKNIIIGGNIGKNRLTPNDKAILDYITCFTQLFNYVDYFVINVSSPNTKDLRKLQDKKPLTEILNALQAINNTKKNPKPILLKISPDLNNVQLDDIIDVIKETKIAGVVSTNTTIERNDLNGYWAHQIKNMGDGGLSGKPLTKRSTQVIKYLKEKSNNAFPIIGVGGINSVSDAMEKLEAGADLVQLYTGFVYHGPKLIKDINKNIIKTKLP